MKATVLIVDDDHGVAKLVRDALKDEGYRAYHADTADKALAFLKEDATDVALLDVELPGVSGLKLLEIIREDPRTAGLPVIMITVKSDQPTKLKGLRGGADDYLAKPFTLAELIARIEALLRRVNRGGRTSGLVRAKEIEVDVERRQARVKGKKLDLTAVEFDLLCLLMRREGRVLTYRNISDGLTGGAKDIASETIYVHIKNLRKALGPLGDKIETLRGIGYRFSEEKS